MSARGAEAEAEVERLAQALLAALRRLGWTVAVAESDSGGLLLAALTAPPGSSAVARGGVVAYHDDLKRNLLGVPADLLAANGAVSEAVVAAMALGARDRCGADLALAASGIAGPGGATATKPVGLTWVAAATPQQVLSREHRWSGDRAANRLATARAALELGLRALGMAPHAVARG